MGNFVLLMVTLIMKEELKYVMIMFGVQYVIMDGIVKMPLLYVDN